MGLFSGIVDTVKSVVGGVSSIVNPLSAVSSFVSPFLSYEGTKDTNSANAAYQAAANQMNIELARENNAANSALADKQMGFQERMSGTAYQRAVGDMIAAGLSPMLAYSQGGASTPSGAIGLQQAASVQPARLSNPMESSINTGFAAQQQRATLENLRLQNANLASTNDQIQSQTALNATNVQKSISDTALNNTLALKAKADTAVSNASAANAVTNNRLLSSQVPRAQNEANAQKSWWSKNIAPYLPDFLKSTSSAAQVRGLFK